MSKPYINIKSEIGKLNRVMLHCPGIELEALTPATMQALLFDDIPYLKVAIQEHNYFAQVLKDNGVEVVYLKQYLQDIFAQPMIRNKFAEEYIESITSNHGTRDYLLNYLSIIPLESFISAVCGGIRRTDIKGYIPKSLSELLDDSDQMFWINPIPNLYFSRDPAACIGNGMTLHHMCKKARSLESLFMKYVHAYHPSFKQTPVFYDRDYEHSIEGGDVIVLSDKVVAIGCSERTSPEAIELLAKNLFTTTPKIEKVLVFKIPKARAFMHLDTLFTMIDYDKFVMFYIGNTPIPVYKIVKSADGELEISHKEELLEKTLSAELDLPHVTIIKCGDGDSIVSQREQWNDASNTFAIAPGVVVVYDRNYITNQVLNKHGIKTIEIPGSELSRGRGGARCMSMPIHRDDI